MLCAGGSGQHRINTFAVAGRELLRSCGCGATRLIRLL